MEIKRQVLRHVLATAAYRTQKAVRKAPPEFADFRAAPGIRTPRELVRHMTDVLGDALTYFEGGEWWADDLEKFRDEVNRFHQVLGKLGHHLDHGTPLRAMTEERMLQGPFTGVIAHAGQLAMLRRFFGNPVPPENFMAAAIDPQNLGPKQPASLGPDGKWEVPGE